MTITKSTYMQGGQGATVNENVGMLGFGSVKQDDDEEADARGQGRGGRGGRAQGGQRGGRRGPKQTLKKTEEDFPTL